MTEKAKKENVSNFSVVIESVPEHGKRRKPPTFVMNKCNIDTKT